ncbi:MAG TPA: protein kinase, partial [Polyangiaceae bacterium]|nr:protein kinase [Polyangiaceae bacterium]
MADPHTSDQASPASETFSAVRFKGTSRYEVVANLGQGGMGVVYEAYDRQRRERVALKTLLHFDAAALYRFKQEFRTLADVGHPNLVHLHELVAGERDNVFFTMELVEGTDFLGYVRSSQARLPDDKTEVRTIVDVPPAPASAARPRRSTGDSKGTRAAPGYNVDRLRHALKQLVDGVRALHDAGKLHRDLKPSNVRVTPEGRVVILDFGVATELRPSTDGVAEDEMVGTATYMAPEQASGEAPVAASDWYSVGVMLYEALVGCAPFTGAMAEVLTLKCTVAPMPPSARVNDVPPDLDELCMALLATDPEARPSTPDLLRRLGATTSDRATAPPLEAGGGRVRLFGRERQQGELEAAFEATGEGRTIAVHVSGKSGLGKSALAHLFLDRVQAREGVLVLRGRAYERESVPYKALDSVVDALTRHLIDMQDRGESIAWPEDVWALAHVFPVLRRVRAIDAVPQASVGDPQVVRQRAFAGLRQIFASLCRQRRVVVFIDDVQWGDSDSAALLVDLVRPPEAPPLLLLMTHRAEEETSSPFLADLRARWPDDAEVRHVTVEPLGIEDARRLVLDLLGAEGPLEQKTAEEIAQEAGGNPFLLEELARGASAHHRAAMGDSLTSGSMRL